MATNIEMEADNQKGIRKMKNKIVLEVGIQCGDVSNVRLVEYTGYLLTQGVYRVTRNTSVYYKVFVIANEKLLVWQKKFDSRTNAFIATATIFDSYADMQNTNSPEVRGQIVNETGQQLAWDIVKRLTD